MRTAWYGPRVPSSLTGPLRIFLALAMLCVLPSGCGDGSGDGGTNAPQLEVLVDDNRGDGRQALDAPLQARRVAIDGDGNLLLAEYDRVRRVDARTGVIDTVEGTVLSPCDGGPPGSACPTTAFTADRRGGIYLASGDGRILHVAAGGRVTHVAGKTVSACAGPPPRLVGPALDVCLPTIVDMAVDVAGNLYFAAGSRSVVLRLDPTRAELVVAAGDGGAGPCVEGVPATPTCIGHPSSIAVDGAGALYVVSDGSLVRRIDPTTGIITRVAGRDSPCEPSSGEEGGPARDACLLPADVAVDDAGHVYLADRLGWTIRRVHTETGRIDTFDTPGLEMPAIAVGPDQRLVAVRRTENGFATVVVRYGDVPGPGTIVAGNGTPDVCGDGGPARDACLGIVTDLAVGGDATFLADVLAVTVRRIDRRGIITRIAGDGRGGYYDSFPTCDDGPSATDTCIEPPLELAAGRDGNVYLLEGLRYPPDEPYNHVRRVDSTGRIETVVGGCTVSGSIYDVPARDACLGIEAIAVDPHGDLYVAERTRISRFDPVSGFLVPIAENATRCDIFSVGELECFAVSSIAVDSQGGVYISDTARLRRFDAASGALSFFAGNGNSGTCGDGGPAIDACLNPTRVGVAADGDVFVQTNGAIRWIEAATGIIETVAGPVDPACAYDGRSGCVTDFALDAAGRVVFVESSRRLLRLTLP